MGTLLSGRHATDARRLRVMPQIEVGALRRQAAVFAGRVILGQPPRRLS